MALERHIEEMWTERVSKEPWLFNGAKFRLHSFQLASPTSPSSSSVSPQHSCCILSSYAPVLDGAEEQEGKLDNGQRQTPPNWSVKQTENTTDKNTDDQEAAALLTLRLGLTCYKDYLGTNWSSRVAELRQQGEKEYSDPLALLAQPLGVGGILCTGDGQVVLIRRSQKVAEAGGQLDIPGGHPEPKVRHFGTCH